MNKCVVTTSWDDGQGYDKKLSSLLLKYGLRGTFYIPKNWEDQPVDEDLVCDLEKNFEIGSHTISHPDLTGISRDYAREEINNSKIWLESLLSHKIDMFSYPKGKYDKDIIKLIDLAGFKGARTLDFQLSLPRNQFILGVGPKASNGSPIIRLKSSLHSKFSFKSFLDWSLNAKSLFDFILQHGGVWHLWGHSWEIEKNSDWKQLESVFEYVSKRRNVAYLSNGEIVKYSSENPR